MTAIFPAELPPVDACPSPECFPGDAPPLAPLSTRETGRGLLADYQCPCGTAWQTRFDQFGWVIERMTADVAERRTAA